MASFSTPHALLRFLRDPDERSDKDPVLLALVAIARDDPLAGRLVVQALLPGLKQLARRAAIASGERDEVWELLLVHVWERTRSYPIERRPRRVAANLLLDTLHATMRELAEERRVQFLTAANPEQFGAINGDEVDVERPLRDAVAAGALSDAEADLILRVRVDRAALKDVAADTHIPYNRARVRLQRAERRLLLFLGRTPVPRRQPRESLSPPEAARAADLPETAVWSRAGNTNGESPSSPCSGTH